MVVVEFIVSKSGVVEDIKVFKSVGEVFDQVVVVVVCQLFDWVLVMDESGQVVVVKMILFFKFKLLVLDGGDEVFQVVEEMFCFLGCEEIVNVEEWQACVNQEFMFYIYENLIYFKVVKEVGVEGMLVFKLVIGKDGVIKDYSISCFVNEAFDVEVLCVVQ